MIPPRPGPSEIRAATAMWGQPPNAKPASPRAKIKRFTSYKNAAGTVLGYIDVQLPSGLIVNGCKLMVGPAGKHWIAPPSQQQTNKDGSPKLDLNGKAVWKEIVEFSDKAARDRFGRAVLDALRAAHPEALDENG
jgi:hypothetical protein